jgi:hypothetical protein
MADDFTVRMIDGLLKKGHVAAFTIPPKLTRGAS